MAKIQNAAFDYSAYDRATADREALEIRHRRNMRVKEDRMAIMKIMALSAVVLVLLFTMIWGRVEISSLCSQQTSQEETLAQLQSENVSLESELAQKTSKTKVEEYATKKLGLQKLDKSQIEYVKVDSGSTAKVVKSDDGNVFLKIKHWFSSALEYIGL